MTSSHEQKRTLFFYLSVRHALFRVLFLHQFGRHWAQNIGFVDPNRMDVFLFWILAGNGRIWRKSEKRGFLDGQKQANMAIFVGDPQVSPTISQGSIIFFLLEDMSVMCLSLLTNTVGLKGKELKNGFSLVIFCTPFLQRYGYPYPFNKLYASLAKKVIYL